MFVFGKTAVFQPEILINHNGNVWFLLNVFGVGVSCRKLYSFVVYLYVDGSGSITSVGEERANLSAVVYL